jgi:hypothetical protein
MEGELFQRLYRLLVSLGKRPAGCIFSDVWIAAVFLWAVLHERPVCWACDADNWPAPWHDRCFPSPSTMSLRLRSESVIRLLDETNQHYQRMPGPHWCKWIDGLPLPVGGSTRDRQARYGRGAGLMAKGYKFHAVVDACGNVVSWRIAPLNVNEKKMAKRMLRDLPRMSGYLTGDGSYDGNEVYAWAEQRGLQMVAAKTEGQEVGHRWQHPARLRSIELQSGPFGQRLLAARGGIDRFFGQWATCPLGLKPLPAWVRGLRRVRLWVQGKLICYCAWRHAKQRVAA